MPAIARGPRSHVPATARCALSLQRKMNHLASFVTKALAPLLVSIFVLQGCSKSNADLLKFKTHNYAMTCYGGASRCSLIYDGTSSDQFPSEPAPDKLPSDLNKVPGVTSFAGSAFGKPMIMKWMARDGTQLSHTVDLNKEIPDHRVAYDHPERLYAEQPFHGDPTIVVEYDDRTVNVYLAATLQVIPLDPANRSVEDVETFKRVYTRTL